MACYNCGPDYFDREHRFDHDHHHKHGYRPYPNVGPYPPRSDFRHNWDRDYDRRDRWDRDYDHRDHPSGGFIIIKPPRMF